MVIKKKPDLTYADVTPKALYMGRRNFLLGLLATTAAVAAGRNSRAISRASPRARFPSS